MHYELFMGAALAEARAAVEAGERPRGAAAVLDEALVASGHEEVMARTDPTAHAIVVTLREAAGAWGGRRSPASRSSRSWSRVPCAWGPCSNRTSTV